MLYRKISTDIEAHLRSGSDKIMVIEGARQIGKSYIIREVGKRLYKNFVEVNFAKADEEYNIPSGIVLDNEREVYTKNKVTYMPVYFVMCIERAEIPEGEYIF